MKKYHPRVLGLCVDLDNQPTLKEGKEFGPSLPFKDAALTGILSLAIPTESSHSLLPSFLVIRTPLILSTSCHSQRMFTNCAAQKYLEKPLFLMITFPC